MAAATVRIHGVKEVTKAFREIDGDLAKQFGNDLKEAAEPVAVSARDKETRYAGASVNTIRARRAGPRVFVGQGARKVTGLRGDFGALQMRTVLMPALDEKANEVYSRVEKVLDGYARGAGF